MLNHIPFKKDLIIAEFGPGTGIFTKQLIEKMSPNSKLYVFELNQEFLHVLEDKFRAYKNVKFICDSASELKEYLQKDGISNVDYIISSLPLSLFNDELRKQIVQDAHDILKSDGVMTQFQYTEQCKNLFVDIFSDVQVKFTLLNIPPAFVYLCKK